jgi:signal peptidase II
VTVFVLALDLFTKFLVFARIPVGVDVPLIEGLLSFIHVHNPGVAFGFMADLPENSRLAILTLIACCGILLISYLIYKNTKLNRVENFALAMMLGGALGNLVNRLWLGHVTDFIDFHWNNRYHFPAFNVADISICLGVALLFLSSVLPKNGTLS